jgi:hypothetical protein
MSRRLSNEVCRHAQIDRKPQERLDKHVARLVNEKQALVLFKCYDWRSRIKRGASLSDAAIDDSDMISEDKNSHLLAYRNLYCSPMLQSTVTPQPCSI